VIGGAYLQVHSTLRDAARVSGASSLAALRDIDVPLIRPALVSAYVLGAVLISGEVNSTAMVFSQSSVTLPILLWRVLTTDEQTQVGYAIALVQLSVTLSLLIVASLLGAGWRRIQATALPS
jgi:ABC-type Fe3+ transport system permease subunit